MIVIDFDSLQSRDLQNFFLQKFSFTPPSRKPSIMRSNRENPAKGREVSRSRGQVEAIHLGVGADGCREAIRQSTRAAPPRPATPRSHYGDALPTSRWRRSSAQQQGTKFLIASSSRISGIAEVLLAVSAAAAEANEAPGPSRQPAGSPTLPRPAPPARPPHQDRRGGRRAGVPAPLQPDGAVTARLRAPGAKATGGESCEEPRQTDKRSSNSPTAGRGGALSVCARRFARVGQ